MVVLLNAQVVMILIKISQTIQTIASDYILLISWSVSRFDPLSTLETTAYNKQNMRAYEFCHFWNRFCPQCNPAVVKLTLVNELFRSM